MRLQHSTFQLNKAACDWCIELLQYMNAVDDDLLSANALRGLRGPKTPRFIVKYGCVDEVIPALVIKDHQPKTTKLFKANCRNIAEVLALPQGADKLIEYVLLCQVNPWFMTFVDKLHLELESLTINDVLMDITQMDGSEFVDALHRLTKYGLLTHANLIAITGDDVPSALVNTLITQPVNSTQALVEPLLHECEPAKFTLDAFPQVNTDLVGGYIDNANTQGLSGISVLLHGESGTGKTELARSLAEYCGYTLYEVSVKAMAKVNKSRGSDNKTPGKERMAYLAILNGLLTHQNQAMLLIDECEHLFEQADTDYTKEHLQQFIEHNAIPCIWITNHVQCLEPSFIRRFKLAIEVPTPRPQDIEAMCKQHFTGLSLSASFKHAVARIEHVSPALIANATHVAKTLQVTHSDAEKTVREVIEDSLHATGLWTDKAHYKGELDFDMSLLNLKQPKGYLDEIGYALAHNKPARVLLCGPPGTGKTAFAHYLTEVNQRDLIRVKCSDILSKWVGESEQQVAKLFHQAHVEEKVILLDEVDSLLVSRESITAHHDLQLVNEFLTQIECFTQPLFAATNFDSRLDKAVLRRFDFKLECNYLNTEQVIQLYQQVLGIKKLKQDERHRLSQLTQLTPGDFAILARRQQFRPTQNHRSTAITLLAEENQRKQPQTTMGFIRPH